MGKATDQRDAQIISLLWTSLLPFHGGDVLCFEVKCFDVLMSVAGSGHVMVTSFDAMWWLVLCHVTWCNAMSWWWAVLLQYYSVLQSTTPVLPCSTKYYSSTTLYYKELLQHCCVLQILLCTTKYYKVLLQYYPVLQSTSKYYSSTNLYYKVLLCTTKYYSSTTLYYTVLLQYQLAPQSTTLYYKVLLQYYPVLQSTTPVRLCTTKYYSSTTPYYKYYSVYSSTTLYYKVLLKYYKVLLQYYSVLQILLCTTPVLRCTTKYYSSTTLYYFSSTLYYKVLLQYSFVLQSTTPVLTCTTKYYSNTTLYYKVLLQYYPVLQILLCTTPVLPCTTKYYSSTSLYYSSTTPVLCTTSVLPCTTKYYSSTTLYYKVLHDWSASQMKRHLQCAEQQSTPSNLTKYCACYAKWISWLIHITYETSFTMRGATGITLQLHQILRLPRKMNLMIDPHHKWNVIYNARSNSQHPPTSPNTAPATQNESHDWSTSHMKRRLHCAEQQASTSNLTKYCACHAKGISWLIRITYEMSFTMRGATGINLQPHQILRLPRKRHVMIDPHHIWNVIYNALSYRHHTPTSPNTAPATQNESHDWSASHMKRHLQCAKLQASTSNLTKYCACHAKGMSWLIVLTYETSFPLRRAAKVTLPLHQVLRLPHNMKVMIDPAHVWNVIYNARSNRYQPATSPNTAPATQNCIP